VANKDNFIKTLETNLTQNKQQLEKINQELTAKCQEISQFEQQNQELEQACLTLEAEAARLQQEVKELSQQNEKLTEDYHQTQTTHHEQLRKINVLFDDQAVNYETIDFEGLYGLLEKIHQEKNLIQQTKTNLLNKIDNYLSQEK